MGSANNKLPVTGPAREALREKGQFWTPDWIAQAMVAYVVSGGADVVFDPAVGAGAFLRAAKAVEAEIGRRLRLRGREVDPGALREALEHGLSEHDVADVEIRDFLREPPTETFRAIVANPPYIRHHRLRPRLKT
ncbi:MAG: N-6 DNA methylase, partial [Armatimonadota bacterium]